MNLEAVKSSQTSPYIVRAEDAYEVNYMNYLNCKFVSTKMVIVAA